MPLVTNDSYDWEGAYSRLAEEAERDYPARWEWEEGAGDLHGIVVGFNPAAPTAFGPSPVAEIETRDRVRWSLWLYSTVLRRAFERENVQIGEVILVRYLGKVQPDGGGSAYHDFRLVVDGRERSGRIDWRDVAQRYQDDVELDPQASPSPAGEPQPADDDEIPF